ncbi:MAG: deoxyribose-phosphate aldolase [Planctomycetes bacterium]|nr:deoxyribose-phosphate aldolase [Planctomycetota bacterium]
MSSTVDTPSQWPLPPAQQGGCAVCTVPRACAVKCPDVVHRVVEAGADRVGAVPGLPAVRGELASLIDHTLLKPEATSADVTKLCAEAAQFSFASVCVNPTWVRLCAEQLRWSKVKVCTVIGFPFGATPPEVKAFEAKVAQQDGATELDMVINVGALKSGDRALVRRDIEGVVDAADWNTIVKVILETSYLTTDEKREACELSKAAGADFVKTSTGYGPGGATAEDIALMRRVVGPSMGVKASGGIRDTETALKMVAAGASRIGASASVKIVGGAAGPAGPTDRGKY